MTCFTYKKQEAPRGHGRYVDVGEKKAHTRLSFLTIKWSLISNWHKWGHFLTSFSHDRLGFCGAAAGPCAPVVTPSKSKRQFCLKNEAYWSHGGKSRISRFIQMVQKDELKLYWGISMECLCEQLWPTVSFFFMQHDARGERLLETQLKYNNKVPHFCRRTETALQMLIKVWTVKNSWAFNQKYLSEPLINLVHYVDDNGLLWKDTQRRLLYLYMWGQKTNEPFINQSQHTIILILRLYSALELRIYK